MSSEGEKHEHKAVNPHLYANETTGDEEVGLTKKGDPLRKDLKNRHMQMIAIGMSSTLLVRARILANLLCSFQVVLLAPVSSSALVLLWPMAARVPLFVRPVWPSGMAAN